MHFLCVLYLTTVKNFQNLQGFLWKATEAWLGGKSYFSHTNPFNFQRPLQSLYTAENLLVTKIWYALSFPTEKIFQKRTIFVFTESWSRDPLLQKKKNPTGEWEVWVEVCLWGLKTLTFATQTHPQGAFPWLLLPCLRHKTIFHDPYSFHFREGVWQNRIRVLTKLFVPDMANLELLSLL